MALQQGTRLGPYRIEAPIGAGGMGEVYKATDTRLDRTVAIKVLPEKVASDPDLRKRFEREAKTISSLSHPNICTLHDVGQEGSTDFLVMEHLEGETLADRLTRKRALPLAEALRYAIEIADALDKAHRKGITHRDLKPGNIMLTKTGAKLLDFGLAKLTRSEARVDLSQLSALPTQEQPLTAQGSLLGTVPYMAPEQLEGKEADARTDIFAFGAIVYEMVTGKRAFQGKSQLSLITAILEHDPPPLSAEAVTPPALDRLVTTCLAKDPDERWQSAGDLGRQLAFVNESAAPESTASSAAAPRPAGWRLFAPEAVIALVVGCVLTGLAAWMLVGSGASPPRAVARFTVPLPPSQQLTNTGRRVIAISPDGSHLAYAANGQIYLRAMAALRATPLGGTEGSLPQGLFFSPDGQWLGFYSTRDDQLKKIAISGGAAVTLCAIDSPYGATWRDDGTIIFGGGGQGIFGVADSGGTPEALISLDSETGEFAHGPQLMPDGRSVLFTLGRLGTISGGNYWNVAQIVIQDLETGERRVVVDGGTDARYLPTGHLVYALSGTLLAVPFDVDRLAATGAPTPLVGDVRHAGASGGANFAISETGSLAYMSADVVGRRTLVWVDREGREEVLPAEPGLYFYPRLSPDGSRIAIDE
jgi:serine/threonine-protein kinase